ncbi:restriction endonuclease subunit S [Mariniradius sediminis]|uniref:Restriction endonuclease subunit S n=1 Tax=Mariniradius sediminis TaxID=2909237 RepID=A0ABS9BS82_9BACT|nr:restriction endonuclease subunit S [Mariniradius sediminis]MCF1750200.1 restriction endonuclease subunit S [Mariniradius sediminis]
MKILSDTIKNIALEIRTGKTPPTSNHEYFGEEINWYTPSDLDKGKFLGKSRRGITGKAISDKKAIVFKPNTVLIGAIGDIGKLGVTSDFSSSNQQITGIYPDPKKVDSQFLYYWLKAHKQSLLDKSKSAIVPILNNKDLGQVKILFPEYISDQLLIANLLSKAENLIAQRNDSIRLLDEFLKSTFLEVFGDPEKNPKNLPFTTLEKLCSVIVDCPHSTPVKSKEATNYPCIRTSELTNGYISWDSMQYLDEDEYKKRTQRLIPEAGDIVYGREGTYGEAIRIPKTHKFSLGQRTMLFRPDYKKTNSIFLWAMVRSEFVYRQAKKKNSGSTVGHVNVKDIKQFRIYNPPIELQTQFAQIVEKTEVLKTQYQQSLQELENLYGSLSQRAFRGELIKY